MNPEQQSNPERPKSIKLANEFNEGWLHFCNCIDFGHSALDADAIRFMNEMPTKIVEALMYFGGD